ncbi:uncharacterized protein LOC143036057 [Oratosquilla oratoria]|uniref:uncharacterized protein LOC143036057 n=1 Tax=Oratosquilla oratoria TaxID=337810 RepID=UPI003F7647EC
MDVTYHLHNGYQLNWTVYNDFIYREKGHNDRFVTSKLMPGFRLDHFYKANFSKKNTEKRNKYGPREIFVKLLRHFSEEKRPALVIINTGTWAVVKSRVDSLEGLDNFLRDISDSAAAIRAVAKKIPVMFWVSDPFKSYGLAYDKRAFNDKLEWTTKTLLWKLRDSDVILWDSTLPLAHSYSRNCLVLGGDPKGYDHLTGSQDWSCFDAIHTGFVAVALRAHVILNYLCNGVEQRQGVCCT